jgi:capsular exopolysaccharide synthesis family protein
MSIGFSSILTAFKRQCIPAGLIFASVMVGAVAYLMYTPKVYETSARLILDEKKVSVSELGRDLARLGESVPGGVNPIATQAEFAKSQRVLKRAIEKLASRGDQNLPQLEQLSKSIRVKIIPATNILEISYQNPDPKTAANLVNAVMESMVEENIESIRAGARSVKTFLQEEVPRQRAILQKVEREENLYRERNGLISVADQTRKLVDNLGDYENQERSLSAQLQEISARNASLKQVIGTVSLKSAYESVRIGQDEELKALRLKLANLETKVIDERARLGDSNPDLLATIEQRNEIRSLYQKKLAPFSSNVVPANQNGANATIPQIDIANDALSQDLISKLIVGEVEQVALEQKMLIIQQEKSDLQSRLADVPVKQQPLTNLVRAREEAENNLKQLQSKLQEATIAEAQLVSNIQIISPADIPLSAEWPKNPVVILIAIFFGLILVVVEVIILELINNSLYDSNEVENILKQPTLGNLPTLPDNLINFNLDAFLDNRLLVEPYHKLLQSLKLRSIEKLRTLVISSAQINEGKSTVAAYLAIVATMSSQKILLIDANLRNPSQHKLFNLMSSKPGLSDVIHGQLVLNEAIQSTEIKNLSILSCGKSSSRPFLELESEEMQSILKTVIEIFDLVIIDTPAINDFSDAITLSRYSDALVLVVRNKISTRNGLNQAVTETTKNRVTIKGFVTNDVKTSPSTNYPNLNYNGSINGHESDTMVKYLKFLPFHNKSHKP